MKKSTFSKYVAILLFITMLTLIALAGTYAKYTSSFQGGGTATTADWNVTVNGEAPGMTTFTLTSTKKIYPGATDIYLGDITVANDSSLVSAQVTSVTAQLPTDSELAGRITLTANSNGEVIAPNSTATIPVYATWEYTTNDETSYASTDISFDITLTVDQVVAVAP